MNVLKKTASLAIVSTLLASVTACGTNSMNDGLSLGAQDQVNALAKRSGKKLTFAIHMAADNNLYTAGLDDINEMEAGLQSDNIEVIVLFDGAKQGDSAIYRIKKDSNGYDKNIISEKLDDKGLIIPASNEIDSGDPAVFHKFIDWVSKNHAADINFYSIWNHGSGLYRNKANASNYPKDGSSFELISGATSSFNSFLAKDRNFSSSSFASDDNGGEMHMHDLNPALETAKRNLGKNVDIFGFDTCLMGHLEAAYQVHGLANYLVASEELEPGDGWDYDAFLKSVSANIGSITPAAISKTLVETYGKSYQPGGSQNGRNVTLSATDVNAAVSGLVPALNSLGDQLKASLPSNKAGIDKVRNATQMFYNKDCADLGHFVAQMKVQNRNNRSLTASAEKVETEYNKAVIANTKSGTTVGNASGLVVYFPKSTMSYNKRYDDAKDIRFAEQANWGSFLKEFTKK